MKPKLLDTTGWITFYRWPEPRIVEPNDPEEWARLRWERLLARWQRQKKAEVR